LLISTICAYILAAILPYLLARTSLNFTVLFYALTLGVVFLLAYHRYRLLENSIMDSGTDEVASEGEERTVQNEAELIPETEAVIQPEVTVAETGITVESDRIIGDEAVEVEPVVEEDEKTEPWMTRIRASRILKIRPQTSGRAWHQHNE
jgi:hypothetical protein